MALPVIAQRIIKNDVLQNYLGTWIEAFLVDRKAQNLTRRSVEYYREKLTIFASYCDGQVITRMGELTPDVLRRFLLFLEERGRSPGGIHSVYRALRAFML